MSGVTVHILTTTGPSTIQRIREEDSHVASVICLDGRAEALPVSAAYEAFVRSPVGIIEKLSGHAAYRMDVSTRVDEGRSWQLAAYIAHVAMMSEQSSDMHVFASGEVDDGLNVRPVEHVAEKLKALSRYLESNDIPSDRAVILLPNTAEDVPSSVNGIPVETVETVPQSLEYVGLGSTPARPVVPQKPVGKSTSRLFRWVSLALAAVIAFWFSADFSRWEALSEQGRALELEEALEQSRDGIGNLRVAAFSKWLSYKTPGMNELKFDGALSVAADEASCADSENVKRLPFQDIYDGDGVVCILEISAFSNTPALSVVGRMAYWPDGLGARERAERTMRGSSKPSGRTWTLPFKAHPVSGAVVRLVSISGATEIVGGQPWYVDLLRSPEGSAAFDAAKRRIETLGYRVAVRHWSRK